jgi:hypothetical protein
MQEAETAEMLYKFYTDPDRYKLPGDRYQLQKKPNFSQLHFFNHAPGIVKRDKGFPGFNACFFEHAVKADVPKDEGENK